MNETVALPSELTWLGRACALARGQPGVDYAVLIRRTVRAEQKLADEHSTRVTVHLPFGKRTGVE